MSYDVNDLIMGGGAKSAVFPTVGTVVKGKILSTEVSQAKEYGTGTPKVWPSGDPMMQAVFTLQTDERDPQDDDDDGTRRLFIDSKNKKDAVRAAVVAAGATRVEVGGVIAMQFTGTDPNGKNPANPPKLYAAQYQPPAVGVNDLLGATAPTQSIAPAPAPQAPINGGVATSLI